MSVFTYGDLNGRPVRAITIRGGGLSATIMEWGSAMLDLRPDGLGRSLILSHPSLDDYVAQGREHVGAIAGRCANRIRGGRFSIDGVAYQVARNVEGRDTLHGGSGGFGCSMWKLGNHGPDHAAFHIRHEDGEEGFPGAISATCTYHLRDGTLHIEMTATTDAPTICNLAQHNYYNLSGSRVIDDHVLQIAADSHTPLADDMAPDGSIAANDAVVDFGAARTVGNAPLDLNYVLAKRRRASPQFAAKLTAGDVTLTVETTEPGLQVYTGDHLPNRARAGICLESQLWPDGANHAEFPSPILRPGDIYRQKMILRIDHAPR